MFDRNIGFFAELPELFALLVVHHCMHLIGLKPQVSE
jgi:hypothetical protein